MLLLRKIRLFTFLSRRTYQVTVVGAAGDIGQTVCLLLRNYPLITKLVLHDNHKHTPGVSLDLAHIPGNANVIGFTGEDNLEKALTNSELVIACGGASRNSGLSEKSWMATNTEFIKTVASKLGRTSPMPFIAIVTEPINCLVPMAAEIIRNHGSYDEKKLFGITGVDVLRAQAIYAAYCNMRPENCTVPVIGGHSQNTLVPLLSQAKPKAKIDDTLFKEFTFKLQNCDESITKAKNGSAPILSVASSVLIFAREIIDALDGKKTKIHAFVENNDFGTAFISGFYNVDKNGAGEMERYSDLTSVECNLLESSLEELRKDVLKGKKILELA